jgi:L-ascorbate metabolism protein UlaG (beta-lactamase superfamily)
MSEVRLFMCPVARGVNLGKVGPMKANRGLLLLMGSLLVAGLCHCTGPGLDKYKDTVVADVPSPPASGVKVTYLGVNGYLLQSRDATVLVDPFFSRMPMRDYVLDGDLKPDEDRIAWGMRRLPPRADLILVTHGHVDHLLDVPRIAQMTGARIVASPTSCHLVRSLKEVPERQIVSVLNDPHPTLKSQETRRFGNVTVQTMYSEHDRICGVDIMPGRHHATGEAPKRGTDWVAGEQLVFIVTMGGKRIYVSSGGVQAPQQDGITPVDLAILGVALPDPRKCLPDTVRVLRPRYIVPSHQDNFFIAPEKGFRFASNSDFDAVQRALPDWKPGQNLILLDYFRPWTLK